MSLSKILCPITCATLLLSACSSTETMTNTVLPEGITEQDIQELSAKVPQVYTTKYFAIGIPEGWNVVSFRDEPMNSHISLEKVDHSSTVTLRITSAENHTIEESCQIAADGFKANGLVFTKDPSIQYGTCIIEAKDNEKENVLWLRTYDDDNSAYSIAYTGSLDNLAEALGHLLPVEKLMQLTVRPL